MATPFLSVYAGEQLKQQVAELADRLEVTLSNVVITFLRAHLAEGVDAAEAQYHTHKRVYRALADKE